MSLGPLQEAGCSEECSRLGDVKNGVSGEHMEACERLWEINADEGLRRSFPNPSL